MVSDKDLQDMRVFQGIEILSPAQFIERELARCVVGEGQHPVSERAGRIADAGQIDRVALDKAADVRAE